MENDAEVETTTEKKETSYSYGGAYGKKGSMPMWAWILIYVIIGGIVYYAGYAIWKAKHPTASNLYGTSGATTTPAAGSTGSLYNY